MEESRLRLARLVAGRRSKFVAIGAWILLVAGLAPFAGKFEGAQKNEPSTFLPGNAESVEVLEAAQTFPSGDATIATIVFHDPSGLNAAERQSIETTLDGLASEAVPGATRAIPPRYSRNGKAAVAAIPIVAKGDVDVLVDAVDAIRSTLEASLPRTVETKVTGPAGFSADASAAFEGINSTLLFATVALVFVLLILIYRSPISGCCRFSPCFSQKVRSEASGTGSPKPASSSTVRPVASCWCSSSEPVPTTRSS